MRKIAILLLMSCSLVAFSQRPSEDNTEGWKKIYRASATKINDLVNTKLDVKFDYTKSWMYGKEWISLHPHFYPTDSLNLDAKGMSINEVAIIKSGKRLPLKYIYDSLQLRIWLDRTYKKGENYTVYINYIAKPNEVKEAGSAAILSAKGLYFINPLGKEKDKPTQIWTQGETESNSCWVPTIDKPNQRGTSEITMTVQDKYKTLSNGLLVSQKKNNDGTRTDTWKMDLPSAPYLMMMAVGEYSIIKDSYKGKEVSYYVEKEFAPVARKIFGETPEMIAFFARITGVEYPWQKYSQIVGRDYVSGAMENTTATLHQESAQQDARQLIDGNSWETVIAHELFHQWFGDYVTTESWSNITLNESFANFSQTLWEEYKYGRDDGDEENFKGMQTYLRGYNSKKDLVRFYYSNREDLFDAVSYEKGGRILNMLRNYVGDSAFFKSLNLYLTTKKLKSAEAHDLRLAFEEVTGQDMNWFWNEWYYGSGHPRLDINYDYDAASGIQKVIIKQTQSDKIFKFRIAIDLYLGKEKQRQLVWCENQVDTFLFHAKTKPELVNVDGDKILLCEKTEHKNMDNYIFQYNKAGLYMDRREAIDYATRKQEENPKALALLKAALKDKYFGLRIYALEKFNLRNDSIKKQLEPLIEEMAKNDPKSLVRAAAIEALGKYKNEQYKPIFLTALNDSSYSIAGNALLALGAIDSTSALEKAKILSAQNVKGALSEAVTNLMFLYGGEADFDLLAGRFENLPFGSAKFSIMQPFASYLKRMNNLNDFKRGIDLIVSFRDTIPKAYQAQVQAYFNGMILNSIANTKQSAGHPEMADYVKSKLPAPAKSNSSSDIPKQDLQKYVGVYDLNGNPARVSLRGDNSLTLLINGQSEMELVPVSKAKFSIKLMEGYSVEFTSNDKDEVIEMVLNSPGGQVKASRKK